MVQQTPHRPNASKGDIVVILSLFSSDSTSDRWKAVTSMTQKNLTVHDLADDAETERLLKGRIERARAWARKTALA